MTDLITVTGIVGSDPRSILTDQNLTITSFRLASTRRVFDRATGMWQDGETNWYTVSSFRNLALNVQTSIRKGEHVVVHGRLRIRSWQTEEKSGTAIEIDADAVGHDLTWGTTVLRRLQPPRPVDVAGDGATDSAAAGARDGSEAIAPASPGLDADGGQAGFAASGSGAADVDGFATDLFGADADGAGVDDAEPAFVLEDAEPALAGLAR